MNASPKSLLTSGLTIHRCIALILGIGVILAVASFLAMAQLRGISKAGEDITHSFHDASIDRATRISEHLARIRFMTLINEHANAEAARTQSKILISPPNRIRFEIASIREDVESLVTIQEEFVNPEFAGIINAISSHSATLANSALPETGPDLAFYNLLDRFSIRISQLRRLNLVAGSELRMRLLSETGINNQRFIAFLAVMLILSGLAIFRLLSSVNHILENERRIQADLQKTNRLLEQEITQGRELASQLRQAQKMEAIGQLTGGIAHDFNNLLTTILGHTELATLVTAEGTPVHNNLEAIGIAGKDAARLIAQLLAFSRKQLLEPKIVNVNIVVANMKKMLTRTLGAQVHLRAKLDPSLWNIRADATQLGQVVMNLAVNARDAMPEGGELVIQTTNRTIDQPLSRETDGVAPCEYVSLSVSDTGTGMERKILEQVFDPFFTTKSVGQGTGLGLSTVYGIVKQSGGEISVRSQVGKGSTFEVLLPRVDKSLDPIHGEQHPAPDRAGNETILVVEDDAGVRSLVGEFLKQQGYRCIEVSGPSEALQLIDDDLAFDLMITDLVMPVIDGRELAKQVRAKRPDLRVLFMSGYASDKQKPSEDSHANTILLNKPFTSQELGEAIHSTLTAPTEKTPQAD